MQARIIDFASDKIAKKLNTIDKDDVRNLYSNISSKLRKTSPKDEVEKVENEKSKEASKMTSKVTRPAEDKAANVSSSEEYCEMLKNEFTFTPGNSLKPDKKIDDSKQTEEATGDSSTDDEKLDELKGLNEVEAACPKDPNRMKSGEIQSFIQKKNVAQGMMDLALVSANCNQLRYVLDMQSAHPYFFTSIGLIICSLSLQVIVGLGMLYSNSYNIKKKAEMKSADRFNNFSIYGVFLITLTNFLISAFSGTNTNVTVVKDEPAVEAPTPEV